MKTTTIILELHSPSYSAKNVQTLCGRYQSDFETMQRATYTIADGVATISSLEPVIATRVNLPMPFCVPVNDLGSGHLVRVEINADTLTAGLAICPKPTSLRLRSEQPALTVQQTLMADYVGLL